jgi:hypothetical protein
MANFEKLLTVVNKNETYNREEHGWIFNRIQKCSCCYYFDGKRIQCSLMCGCMNAIVNKRSKCVKGYWKSEES